MCGKYGMSRPSSDSKTAIAITYTLKVSMVLSKFKGR